MTKHDVFEPADSRFNMAHTIDGLRLSKSDRRIAEEAMHNGELMAELICRAGENLRSAAALVSKAFASAKSGPISRR
jgi:hypothetical protein